MTNAFEPKRIKRITSHSGHARFLATLTDTQVVTKRFAAIPSPYCYSPVHILYRDSEGRLVFIVETAHKRYDVFTLPDGAELIPVTEVL